MDRRENNLIISACAFVLGGLYVLADTAGITANVIGYTGSSQSVTSIIGMIMLVASAIYFMLMLHSHSDRMDLERLARVSEKTEVIKSAMSDQDLEEKYKTEEKHKK